MPITPLRTTLALVALLLVSGCSSTPPPATSGFYIPFGDTGGGLPGTDWDALGGDVANRPDTPVTADVQPTADVQGGSDAGKADAGLADGAVVDAALTDSGPVDASAVDGGVVDSGVVDSGVVDSGVVDSGPADVGKPDVGQPDVGKPDIGKPDIGTPPIGEDIAWGSDPNVPPYDAGQYEYDIVGGGGPGPGLCNPAFTEIDLEKKQVGGKVDIIIFVDTSGSMGQEAKWTNDQMNNFAQYLVAKNMDLRVILLEQDTGCCKMCIQPPLGGPNCGNNPPKFIHQKVYISSTNGLAQFIASYPQWSQWLRPDATKNIVAVTDDNSYKKNPWFEQQIDLLNTQAKQKGQPEQFQKTPQIPYGFVFHSIVAYPTSAQCPTMASLGSVYLELTDKTKGAKFKICEKDWTPIFQNLAYAVSLTAKPGCTYPLEKPPGVQTTDDLSLVYVAEDDDFPVPSSPGNVCPASGVGFTFDNPANPSKVTLCPVSCSKLNGGGNLVFNFGCG